MRVIITGGRDYDNVDHIYNVLQKIHDATPITCIVHGACKTGVDNIADDWAKQHGIKREPHPADWPNHGLAAGPIRNEQMAIAGADLCIAFPGNRGTTNMINNAKRYQIRVLRVEPNQDIKI